MAPLAVPRARRTSGSSTSSQPSLTLLPAIPITRLTEADPAVLYTLPVLEALGSYPPLLLYEASTQARGTASTQARGSFWPDPDSERGAAGSPGNSSYHRLAKGWQLRR